MLTTESDGIVTHQILLENVKLEAMTLFICALWRHNID